MKIKASVYAIVVSRRVGNNIPNNVLDLDIYFSV